MYTPDFTQHYWNSTKDPKCVQFQITILLHFLIFRQYIFDCSSLSPLWNERHPSDHLNKPEFPSSNDDVCQVWSILVHWFGKRVFQFRQRIFALSLSSPLGKGRDSLNLESLSFKDAECQVWLILSQRFWKRRFVLFLRKGIHK